MNQTVTTQDLRALLDSTVDDAALVLVEGKPQIVAAPGDDYAVIVTRDDLVAQLPEERPVDETVLEFHAGNLDAAIDSLGG